jgi:ribosomal-protein-alanine N-acetyltransferase
VSVPEIAGFVQPSGRRRRDGEGHRVDQQPEVVAETERLMLRRITHADLDAYAALNADPEVTRYLGSGRIRTREETLAEIDYILRMYDDCGYSLWATVRKQDGTFIGRCGLLNWQLDGRDEVEVAYGLARPFWGLGYASEAARAVREWAFAYLDVDRLVSLVVPENEASKNVAKKNGMRFERYSTLRGLRVEVYAIDRGAADG